MRQLTILAVCDEVDARLYGALDTQAALEAQRGLDGRRGLDSQCGLDAGRARPDLLVGCGDLPAYYLDYLVSRLDAPLYAVHGNHDAPPSSEEAQRFTRCGATWLGGRTLRTPSGVLIAGFDGCLRYNGGAYQATELEMHAQVRRMVPHLWLNKLRYGRFLDVLVTHAPPEGIHDRGEDRVHKGFSAFRWLLEHFRPRYHLHGHVHVYDRRRPTTTWLGPTQVVNVYPFRELAVSVPDA
jgi:Icc-related predicted phosphoesterase